MTFRLQNRQTVVKSFVLPWTDIKSYRATIGPGLARPPRPTACPVCPWERIWYDGWRWVSGEVLGPGGEVERFDGLPVQRAACSKCWKSWTLWPAFLYPRRQFAPDVNAAAVVAYLADPGATYVKVAARYGCSWTSVWRWVGWLGQLVAPEELLAAIMRVESDSPAVSLVPREVPQDDHDKAYTPERARRLLRAFRTMVLIELLSRALSVPPADPSALRWLLFGAVPGVPAPDQPGRADTVPGLLYRLARPT